MIDILLQAKADIDRQTGVTLHCTLMLLWKSATMMLRCCCGRDKGVVVQDRAKKTALHIAVASEDYTICVTLLKQGASVDMADEVTPILQCV